MDVLSCGNTDSKTILIQPVDSHSIGSLDDEFNMIRDMSHVDLCLKAVIVDNWFSDLSPWKNPPVFGNDAFGDGAKDTLEYILSLCGDKNAIYLIGGYSLAGLFSLWAAHKTGIFTGVAAASPSVWFPGFIDFINENTINCDCVYLSLGDKEGRTKNRIMSTVDNCISSARETFSDSVKHCTLEYNPGNHFTDVTKRSAKAFAWVLERIRATITP